MTELLHITERAVWEDAASTGAYQMSTRGVSLAHQGFIHCSLPHQLREVAEAIYADAGDLVVLVIEPSKLTSPVKYEAGDGAPGGEQYPHIYGPLPVAAVTAVIPVTRDAAGQMLLPERAEEFGRAEQIPLPEQIPQADQSEPADVNPGPRPR